MPPPKRYTLTGQVLAVNADAPALTIKHGDIPDFMPAMTMTYHRRDEGAARGPHAGRAHHGHARGRATRGRARRDHAHRRGAAAARQRSRHGRRDSSSVGEIVPDVALIDQNDQRRSFNDWRGSLTLITFIYTRCPLPNFCPLMDQNFAALQRAIAKDPTLAGRVKLLSISFDPEYDTPAVLAAHAARLKADPAVWTFATGDRVTIDRLAGKFGVSVIRTPADAAQITHNLRTTLIGARRPDREVLHGQRLDAGRRARRPARRVK